MSKRRAAAWLSAIPLMLVGSQVAHVFAYRLAYPVARVRLRELVVTGHGYLGFWPVLLGIAAGLELAALGSVVAGSFQRRRSTPVAPWAFAVMPLLAFVVQEFLERWLAGGSFPWWMILQPTFRIGLLLQLPFGLLAYLVARLLLGVAGDVGSALRRLADSATPLGVRATWSPFELAQVRLPALAHGRTSRGPPTAAPARLS